MATIGLIVSDQVDIERKPRLYFSCHPEDLKDCLCRICGEIFECVDCGIYHTPDMTEPLTEKEKCLDIARCNLFVIPVTRKLLTEPCRAMETDLVCALRAGVPILPLMMEEGLDALYNACESFSGLQYLAPWLRDPTAISYKEKLEKFLSTVLLNKETEAQIRGAFRGHLFMSYRKKDRNYANNLMRTIHKLPQCRDVAIWFDEFLTPGESFRKNIEDTVERCDLVILLVTPRIVEKVVNEEGNLEDNYVVSTELPFSRRKGKSILAVEMERTDPAVLRSIGIAETTAPTDTARLSSCILQALPPAPAEEDDPERSYLIGLGYLYGINVETDAVTGLELITSAADRGFTEAAQKLVSVYKYGIGVRRSLKKALERQLQYAKLCMKNKGTPEDVYWSLLDAGDLCVELRDETSAKVLYEQAVSTGELLNAGLGDSAAYLRLASLSPEEAKALLQKACALQKTLWENKKDDESRLNLAKVLIHIAGVSSKADAEEYYGEAMEVLQPLADAGLYQAWREMGYCAERLGLLSKNAGQRSRAKDCYMESYARYEKQNTIKESEDSLRCMTVAATNLGHLCREEGNFSDAEAYYNKAVKLCVRRQMLWPSPDALNMKKKLRLPMGRVYDLKGDALLAEGKPREAMDAYQAAMKLRGEVNEEERTSESMYELSLSFKKLGDMFNLAGDQEKAELAYSQKVAFCRALKEEKETLQTRRDLMIALGDAGYACLKNEKTEQAGQLLFEAYAIANAIGTETGTPQSKKDLVITLNRIAEFGAHLQRQDIVEGMCKLILHWSSMLLQQENTTENVDDFGKALLLAALYGCREKKQYLQSAADIYRGLCEDDPEREYFREMLSYVQKLLEE